MNPRNPRLNVAKAQRGSILLEGMIAILIFSMGILALMGMQAQSVKNTGDAKYRADASFLANKVIASMWTADPVNLTGDFQTGGAKFLQWRDNDVRGTSTGLPGGDATVQFGANRLVTVRVLWQAPQDTTQHNYTTVTQVCTNQAVTAALC
jgi:type IV pilus assembly protein PilV